MVWEQYATNLVASTEELHARFGPVSTKAGEVQFAILPAMAPCEELVSLLFCGL